MNVLATLVLGVLIGWLAEWTIDWIYWRGRIQGLVNENTTLREQLTSLKEQLTSLKARKTPTLFSAKNIPITDKEGNDNFQAIKGIGPVFAKRLKEAGVTTFEQLSKLKSAQLEEILGSLYKRFFSKQETILAQAKEFAKQKKQSRLG
jgi:predicted flap endonuclease-1-like 5' DNA nuclease